MSAVLPQIILFIVGLICLVKGGDWFVEGATGIAHHFRMPEILIGATVVSIGTTIPEVMVSSTAALTGAGSIAYGNAIGSIICNTSLIAAITMTFRPAPVERNSIKTPIIFFFASAIFYAATAYISGYFSRITGIILLAVFVLYMYMCVRKAKAASEVVVLTGESPETKLEPSVKERSMLWNVIFLILGTIAIAIGADLLVDNGTVLAEAAGVPQSVIALTFVALGTSLPELVTAITALVKGHSDLSLGNVIGANLFNLVLVSGLSTTLSPFYIPTEKTIAGMNASLVVDVPLMFTVMLIMCLPALIKGKFYRGQGILLLGLYAAFVAFQFVA